ncbi:TPA: hypothetical protein DCX16_02175, partial [bacterium]|nr:hypothetical protein [bacterium]
EMTKQSPKEAYVMTNLAYKEAKKVKDKSLEAYAAFTLASLSLMLSRYNEAIKLYQDSLTIFKEFDDKEAIGAVLGGLGVVYNSLGDYQKVIGDYEEALNIAKEIGDRQGEGNRLGNLGNAYHSLGQYQKAIGYYNDALEIAKEIGDVDGERLAYLEIGNVYTEFYKDLDKAYEYYEKSIGLLENMRRLITKREYKMEGLLPRQGISAYDKIILNIVSRKERKYEKAWEYAERSKAQNLAELLKEDVLLPKDKIKPIISPKTAIVEFFVTEKETIVFILIEGKSLSETTIELVDFKESDLRDLTNNWLSKYYEYLSKYKDYKDNRNETALSACLKAIENWRTTMKDTLKALYENLFSRINELLTESGIEHIIIVPHRALHLLPLHASFIERDGKREYLIDKYSISYAPSSYVLSLCQQRNKRDNNSFLGINNPDMSLKFSDYEIDQVKSHFKKQDVLRHSVATREAILKEAPKYGVIHFSCHGEFNPWAPLESSLILANGHLILRDIFKELKLPNTSMVVLSACETGMSELSESDEYVGLPSGFLYAGSPVVIGSLWTVNDESTALLMEKFYENLYKNGLSIAKALKDAQVWLRDKYKYKDYSHPYYWAGFFACGKVG